MGTWWKGEDPPDAYLQLNNKIIAVEISRLIQQIHDGKGGLRSRLSEDSTATRLADELDKELHAELPEGIVVLLTVTTPISMKFRKLKTLLKGEICHLISCLCVSEIEKAILDNTITIRVDVCDEPSSGRKIFGVCGSNASRNIFENAWIMMEERILTKAKKCSSLPLDHPKWLVLLNDYSLADVACYQQAIRAFSVDHSFEKILMVSRDRSVAILQEKDCPNF